MKETELEKTYLAKALPEELERAEPKNMIDVYFPAAAAHPVLRLRKLGQEYTMTKKYPAKPGDASAMIEETIVLTREEYDAFAQTKGKRLVKDRYSINIGNRPAEVDVFKEDLAGLVLIDFEFENRREKQQFTMPGIALADVTQEDFIAGGMLSGKSYSDIESGLKKYNYRKLVKLRRQSGGKL